MRSGTVSYSEEIADQLLEHIENGGTIASACKLDGMPSPSTLRRWRKGDGQGVSEDFAERFEKALTIRLEGFVDDLLQLPRDIDPDHPGELQRARLECENRRWLLSKMLRKQFGDRSAVDMGGQKENPFNPTHAALKSAKTMMPELAAVVRKAARIAITVGDGEGAEMARQELREILDRMPSVDWEVNCDGPQPI
jgi:transcriptional regulator with XRE-family HTH domain